MGLGDLYQQDVDAGLGAMAQRPLPPPPKDERSAWGAPWRAVKAAAGEVIGSTADVLGAYGQVMAGTDAPLGSPEHKKLQAGVDMSSESGDLFRGEARSLRPDPLTASTAEQVVFGVTRPLAKLITGGALLGPFGLAGAAAEEGFTQADDLRQEGVDLGTRSKVGALTAAATFGAAAMPLAGSTLGRTAALYLAGGPGGFMAQQAATRAILQHADYDRIAQQFDPLDPMGLAISALIPLPFAAHGAFRVARAGRAEPARVRIEPTMEAAPAVHVEEPPAFGDTQPAVHVPDEVVDAAMVQNLTRLADAHEAVAESGAPAADALARIAQNLADFPSVDPKGMPLVEFSKWAKERRQSRDALAVELEAQADGLVVPARTGGFWGVTKEVRPDGDEWRVTRFDDDWTPIGHQAHATARAAVADVIAAADPQRMPPVTRAEVQAEARQAAAAPKAEPPAAPKIEGEGNPLDVATLTRTEPEAVKDRTPEHVASVTERAAQIEAEKPDTVVRHDEAGKPVTAAEEMARIRQEIAEGTDIDLGTLDADLVRVAAACALSTGA